MNRRPVAESWSDIADPKELGRRIARLNSLKEQVLRAGSLSERLKLITDGVVELFGADFARIWVVKEGDLCAKGCRHAAVVAGPDACRDRGRCLHLVASSGRYSRTDGRRCRVPLGRFKIGRLASGVCSMFVANYVAHGSPVHDRPRTESVGLVSSAGCRLFSPEGRPLGVLAMFSRKTIAPEEQVLLEDLAATASHVVLEGIAEELLRQSEQSIGRQLAEIEAKTETARRLHEEAQQRVRDEQALLSEVRTLQRLLQSSENERRLIAYEIHDGLAQQLEASRMYFHAFESLRDQDPGSAVEAYERGTDLLQEGMSEARRLIDGARTPILDEHGIEAAIAHLVHAWQGPDRPSVEFHSDIAFGRLDATVENAIYRIAQAALANACKHSRSDRVRISLVQQESFVRLEIQDWGVGYDPSQSRESCFGLEGMRKRALLLGGRATIESAPGKGTHVRVELPFVFSMRTPDANQESAQTAASQLPSRANA